MSNGEDEITAWFARQNNLPTDKFPIGIGDDMAEIALHNGESIFITTDMLLEGVHFDLQQATIEQVGYKAMAVSLSDCAAMATVPVAAVVAAGLPKGFGKEQLKELHRGIRRAGDKFGCALVGGDITSWDEKKGLVISAAMLSKRADNEPVRRNGAEADDVICVTGELGGSQFGKHLCFEPRVNEALKLTGLVKINAMLDISDGLSSDLNRICTQSKVGAVVEANKIPISRDAQKSPDPLSSALNEGEDFELLFTLAQNEFEKLQKKWNSDLPISAIGKVTPAYPVQLKMPDGSVRELTPGGYDHLKE